MAYWKCSNISSQADTILSKENLTLTEVLDIENVIQDAKNGNKKLLDFLFQPNILEELIDLITKEPNPELPDNEKYRHPFIACELLTTDVIVISRPIADNKHLLDKLLSFVDQTPPLNPLLASFFSRTIVSFFTRSVHQDYYLYQYICLKVLESMKEKEGFVKQLVAHIGTSAIMELILKMVKEAETFDMQLSISLWLYGEGLITQLLETLNPKADPICQYNAAQLLCDMGKEFIDEVNKPNVMVEILETTNAVTVLLDTILGDEFCEPSIVGGISVLLMLLPSIILHVVKIDYKDSDSDPLAVLKYGDEKSDVVAEEQNKESEPVNGTDTQQPWHQTESIVIRAIIPKLKTFHQLLQEPPPKPSFFSKTVSDPPLGNTRLRVSALIASLIVLNNQEVINELIELNIFQTLLDLFCRYPWNNFYHTQFETCITYALKPVSTRKSEDNPLIKHLFIDCELMQFVLKLWENNKISMECENGRRQGYMGHLIEIASVINSTVKENSAVEPLLNEHFPDVLTQWNQLVDDELNPTLECQKECLSGIHPRDAQPEDEVTTSDKFSGKKFSEFRTESYWENDANMDENVNNDVDEAMFQDMCAQKSNSWNSDALPFDENDEDENENGDDDDDDSIDNEEEMEEGNSEENSSPNSEKKHSPLRSRVFRPRRKDRYRNANFQPQDDKGMDSKIFINENAPFIADTDKIHFDMAFSSVSFSPWKQTFDDNANTGWADFEANFGSPTASQFNSVAFSDPESKNKIETETSNFNGPKNDPFAVGQIVTNSCSLQEESFLNDNDFGSFESATSFEINDPFKDKETFNFYRICDKEAFDSIDKNEKLESNIDKTFETFDFNAEKASGMPECTAEEAFKTPEPNVEATKLAESNLDKVSGSPESDVEKTILNEASGLFESSVERIEGASESNIDKTFEFSESNKDKFLNNSESSTDKDFGTPELDPDEAFETPNSSLDKAFETPDSSLDKFCEAADSAIDESFEKIALHDKMCALELSENVGSTAELIPDIPAISEVNPESKSDSPAGVESNPDELAKTIAAAEESNKIVINDTGKGDECLDKVTKEEKCLDPAVVALESPSTPQEKKNCEKV